MRRELVLAIAAIVAFHLSTHDARAATGDGEARLREALRNAITQLRSLEDERAVLQAKQTESAKEAELLRQQVEDLTKQAGERPAESKVDYEKAVAEFNSHLAAQNETITRLNDSLEKWKAAYGEAANVARVKETERAMLAGRIESVVKRTAMCEEKNANLVNVSNEILNRYARMDIGDAVSSREPFVGFKRVQLQNIVQDYQDKLLDGKLVP